MDKAVIYGAIFALKSLLRGRFSEEGRQRIEAEREKAILEQLRFFREEMKGYTQARAIQILGRDGTEDKDLHNR